MARKYRYTLSIGYANAMHEEIREFDDEELEGMSEEEIEKFVAEDYDSWVTMYMDGGWTRIED